MNSRKELAQDYVFVGPFCEIQKGVKVGAESIIQSHTFICSGVEIGENCFIGHGVMFTNDRLQGSSPEFDPSKWEKTMIGNNVLIGSNSTILPVSICDDVVIGAGAVVTKDIKNPGTYVGNPARLLVANG